MSDSLEVYQSNLLNPLLTAFAQTTRLGTLASARQAEDQLLFSRHFAIQQYLQGLKQALQAVPQSSISLPAGGAVVAGVQLHNISDELQVNIAPPAHIDVTGSYSHGSTLVVHPNIDLVLTLPENFISEKEFQNYTYFDKRAVYVAAIAAHLRHYDTLAYANVIISHEPNDPLKPIIIIHPSKPVKSITKRDDNGNIVLHKAQGLLGQSNIILHFVPQLNSIALRKLAPNRNNVKKIHQQHWNDPSQVLTSQIALDGSGIDNSHALDESSESNKHLTQTTIISNIAPTPDYNQQIIQDLLSIPNEYVCATVLAQNGQLVDLIALLKVWLQLRGLYLTTVLPFRSDDLKAQTGIVSGHQVDAYNAFIAQQQPQQPQDKNSKKLNKQQPKTTKKANVSLETLLNQSTTGYSYTGHHIHNTSGITGSQLTYIVVHLVLQGKLTTSTSLQQMFDIVLRFFIHKYPNNQPYQSPHSFLPTITTTLNTTHHDGNLMATPLALPPDFDQGNTIELLQQIQQDMRDIYQQTPAEDLFHAFDIVLLDANGALNVLHTLPASTWQQIQFHALYALKLIYGNNTGSLLSQNITAQLLSGNYATALSNCNLTPQTEERVFDALFLQQLANSKLSPYQKTPLLPQITQDQHQEALNNDISIDVYFQQLHQAYLKQIDQLCQQRFFSQPEIPTALKTSASNHTLVEDGFDSFIQLQQRYSQYSFDKSLMLFDSTYDVSLSQQYLPFYPIIAVYLQHLRNGDDNLSDKNLHRELLIKINVVTPTAMPLLSYPETLNTRVVTTSASTVVGKEQSVEAALIDGDLAMYIPHIHLPTQPLYQSVTRRMHNILVHSLSNRVFNLHIEPRLNITKTAFIWRISVQFNPAEANRDIDRGPFAEQQLKCKQWRAWWGKTKSQVRRFPDGAILECVNWSVDHPAALFAPNEQLSLVIAQYMLPLHLFSSPHFSPVLLPAASSLPTTQQLFTNACVVTTPTHPLGAFIQQKNLRHLVDMLSDASSAPILHDKHSPNPAQYLPTVNTVTRLVSATMPIPSSILYAYNTLSFVLKELRGLPLGIKDITPTSAVLRGTTPYYPTQHIPASASHRHPCENDALEINNFLSQLQFQRTPAQSDELVGNPVYEPMNLLLTLGDSSKWPKDDLLALSRVKTAFYLKLGEIITQHYSGNISAPTTFDDAQKKVNKKHKNRGSAQQQQVLVTDDHDSQAHSSMATIYAQVTPYYVDIYVNGYVFRCRIVVPHEIPLFRRVTGTSSSAPPLALGDGTFRTVEREYLFRPQHNVMIKAIAANYKQFSLTVQVIYRWLSSHYVSRSLTIELVELLVASVFVNSAPYFIPNSLHAAVFRVLTRIATFPWSSEPLLVPHIVSSFSTDSSQIKPIVPKYQPSLAQMNHTNASPFAHTEYSTDINIDMLPTIFANFNRRKENFTASSFYIVTAYDLESRAWTTRASNHIQYADHVEAYRRYLQHRHIAQRNGEDKDDEDDDDKKNKKNVGKLNFKSISFATPSDDDDDDEDDEHHIDNDDGEQMFALLGQNAVAANIRDLEFRLLYSSLIDRGESPILTKNTSTLVDSFTTDDMHKLQLLTAIATPTLTTLFHNSITTSPIHKQTLTATKQAKFFKASAWPLKAPVGWTFKHFLGLFKPQLQCFDAFILIHPNALTTDTIARSLWLYKTKNNTKEDEYACFDALASRKLHKIADKSNKNAEFKLPADLAYKLQQQQKQQQQDAEYETTFRETVPIHAGLDFVAAYLEQLRGTFGQYASFYVDPYAPRVIAVKFHPFLQKSAIQVKQLEQRLQHIATKKATIALTNTTDDRDPFILHSLQHSAHLTGYQLDTKQKLLQFNQDDVFDQMCQLGSGIVQAGFNDFEAFIENVFF